MPNDSNKLIGKTLPETINPPERVCFIVEIPDTRQYRAALLGQLEWLADWRCWEHYQEDYANPPERNLEAAQLFVNAVTEAEFEDCMDCEQVGDCIENDEGTQAALASAINNSAIIQEALEQAFNPAQGGSAIPPGYANKNQYGAALGCEMDDGWGHIRDGLVARSFDRVQQVLERIEFVTDNQEMLAEFINAIPGVGAFFDVIPVTDWVLWFDNVRAFMKEGFEAGDSTELRDQVACDLFCIWQIDCSLSVEQIRQYYWSKTAALAIEWESAFDSMSELAATLAAATDVLTPETIVYALVGSQYGFLTFVNDWFGIHINATAGDLALGAASAGWMTLCDDCTPAIVFKLYADFIQTVFVSDIEIAPGVEFDIEINPADFPFGEIVMRPAVASNWRLTYTATGTIVATTAETAWSYKLPDDSFDFELPGILTNMPSPADGKLWFWNNNEALDGIATYTLHITLDVIP